MDTGPKLTRGSLDLVNNTYVVQNGLLFEYYSISTEPFAVGDKFIKFEISPATMAPGVAIVGKKMYDVPLRDLVRRRIDVSRLRRTESNSDESTDSNPAKQTRRKGIIKLNSNESGSGTISGDEISKVADLAWENQVDSLLEIIHSKEGEEIEVTSSTQSGQIDEDCSIPDIFEDIK